MKPLDETTARLLLERYHQGETSLEEEQQLSSYFCSEAIPQELLPYRALFRFFRAEAAVTPPESVPQRAPRTRRNLILFLAPIASIAAGVALFFMLHQPPPPPEELVCYVDGKRIHNHQEALQMAQQQWEQITAKLERANAMAGKLEQITHYTETINKYLPK
jgi:hypothetical protein